jgi:hypothetical protein
VYKKKAGGQCKVKMSKAVAKAILPGAGATIMYGLYYTWKKRRMEEWRKSETAVALEEGEKLCLQSMLSGKSVVQNALQLLKGMLLTDFGFDISKQFEEIQPDANFTGKYKLLLDYHLFLQKVHTMYHNHAKQVSATAAHNACNDLPGFFKEWFVQFPFSNSQNASTSAGNVEDELIRRAKDTTEQMIRSVVQTNKSTQDDWIQSMDLFIQALKQHKCINVDSGPDFAGLKKVFEE